MVKGDLYVVGETFNIVQAGASGATGKVETISATGLVETIFWFETSYPNVRL